MFAYEFCSHCKVVPTGWGSITKLYDVADKIGFGNPAERANEFVSSVQKLVDGAVGMVEVALKNLEDKKIVSLTSDQRAVLVTNMMTVLLSETGAQPVIQMTQSTQ